MTITFQKEMFLKLMPELPEFFLIHDSEVEESDNTPIDVDWQRYLGMEANGLLHIMAARDGKKLIGYYIAMVVPHLHRKHRLCAYSDMFFLLPEYRNGWTGYKLFTETEKMFKSLGVRKSYLVTKVKMPITIMIKRLKYVLIERVHIKML